MDVIVRGMPGGSGAGAKAVRSAGGRVERRLGIIDGVAGRVPAAAIDGCVSRMSNQRDGRGMEGRHLERQPLEPQQLAHLVALGRHHLDQQQLDGNGVERLALVGHGMGRFALERRALVRQPLERLALVRQPLE